jgi:hypothetical protein
VSRDKGVFLVELGNLAFSSLVLLSTLLNLISKTYCEVVSKNLVLPQ